MSIAKNIKIRNAHRSLLPISIIVFNRILCIVRLRHLKKNPIKCYFIVSCSDIMFLLVYEVIGRNQSIIVVFLFIYQSVIISESYKHLVLAVLPLSS
jgi:hypothetical protein